MIDDIFISNTNAYAYPEVDYLIFRNAKGFSPTPATLSLVQYAVQAGAYVDSSHVSERTIEITFSVNPKYITKDRHLLYDILNPGDEVYISVNAHGDWYDITGYVTSIDVNVFELDPTAVVTIVCGYPAFRGLNTVYVSRAMASTTRFVETVRGSSLVFPEFYFHYGNLTKPGKIIMSWSNKLGLGSLTVDLSKASGSYDLIHVMTKIAGKYVATELYDGSMCSNLMAGVLTGDSWPVLPPGDTTFSVQQVGAASAGSIVTIYNPMYSGL